MAHRLMFERITHLCVPALAAGLAQRVEVEESRGRPRPSLNQHPALAVLLCVTEALEGLFAPVGLGEDCLEVCLLHNLTVRNELLWDRHSRAQRSTLQSAGACDRPGWTGTEFLGQACALTAGQRPSRTLADPGEASMTLLRGTSCTSMLRMLSQNMNSSSDCMATIEI